MTVVFREWLSAVIVGQIDGTQFQPVAGFLESKFLPKPAE